MKRLFPLTALLLCTASVMLLACRPKPRQAVTASSPIEAGMDSLGIPLPEIPSVLSTAEERKAFLLTHFWDKYDFSDTTTVNGIPRAEEDCAVYVSILADEESATLRKASFDAFGETLVKKGEETCDAFLDMMKELLFNPNSIHYNETLYAEFLRSMCRNVPKNDVRLTTFNYRLELIERNNPGAKASDFEYFLKDGSRNTLLRTPVKGNRLLLLFYDPECGHCSEVTDQMRASESLRRAVQDGKLTLLAVYTEGNDEIWKSTLSDLPEEWLTATDRESVRMLSLYDLKAMPSLYLLDGKKRVILKDASFERICKELGL